MALTSSVEGGIAAARTGLSAPFAAASNLLDRLRRPKRLQCHVVSRGELSDHPIWRSTLSASRKDHRYYEIIEDTLHDRFEYRYFVIADEAGNALAIQPFFVMDQDMLEGVAQLSRAASAIRKVFPRFMMVRTLMVGCTAGEGHLAASPA